MAAPTGLPAPVQQRLEQALERVAAQPEVKAAMLKAGAEPAWGNAQSLASFMQADTAQWKKVAAFANITLD
jgi:tripartite-type tricarboxylate transporter receptor subunit TctC